MTASPNIDELLQGPVSHKTAAQLVAWADEKRRELAHGDIILGILSVDEANKIPQAYLVAPQNGLAEAWIRLAHWYIVPDFGNQDIEAAEDAIRAAMDAEVTGAKLELTKLRWFTVEKRRRKRKEDKRTKLQPKSRQTSQTTPKRSTYLDFNYPWLWRCCFS